jgi:hypothetical protein
MASQTRQPTRARQPAAAASARATATPGDQAFADEHPLMALQRAIGNRAVQRMLRDATEIRRRLSRSPRSDEIALTRMTEGAPAPARPVQRAGWTGPDIDPKSPNAKDAAVGKMRRVPLQGLTEGNQAPDPTGSTDELAGGKNQGRAIAVVPEQAFQTIDPAKPIEVLLHLHGMSVPKLYSPGYRARKTAGPDLPGAAKGASDIGTVRDVSLDRVEAQVESLIAGSKRQIVAVLPQGTTGSGFGAGFKPDALLAEVFQMLVAGKFLPTGSTPGPVTFSGHSGGGNTMISAMAGDLRGSKTGPQLPKNMGDLLLFDAINGDSQISTVNDYLGKRFKVDVTNLEALIKQGKSVQEQTDYLAGSFRFRGVFTQGGYAPRYAKVQAAIDGLIAGAKRRLKLDAQVVAALKENYKTSAAGTVTVVDPKKKKPVAVGVHHEAMLGHDDNLAKAMSRPATQPSGAPAVTPSPAPVKTGSLESGQESLDAQLAQAGEPPEPVTLAEAG